MNKFNYLLIFLFGLTVLSCAKEEVINPDQNQDGYEIAYKKGKSKNGKSKKFKNVRFLAGKIDYTMAGPSSCSCGTALAGPLFQGSGKIKSMGLVTADVSSCVTPIPNSMDLDVVNSCATLVGPTGDELFLDVDPYTLTFNPADTSYKGFSKIMVTGGTGKYKDAKGRLNVYLTQDANFNVNSIWSGVIKY